MFEGGADVRLRTEDGLQLTAWWAPAIGWRGRDGAGRARKCWVARASRAAGPGADRPRAQRVVGGYRGYGGDPGAPTEDGLAADVRAAYRYLTEDRGVNPHRLVLFGESLGGAVLTRLATERPVGGLVLRSPFTSLADAGARAYPFLPVRMLLRERYPLREQVRAVRVPVAVVAGAADEVVPATQSRAVAAAAGAFYVELPRARHNDEELVSGPAVVDAVIAVSDR